MEQSLRVACNCNGLRASGTYEVSGDWLILHSSFGAYRVRLGIANPRRLAARLMKNTCSKAVAQTAVGVPQPFCSPNVFDKAQQMIHVQRDKIAAMASDHPQRVNEERMLDQMITNARLIDTARFLLNPKPSGPPKTEDAVVTAQPQR